MKYYGKRLEQWIRQYVPTGLNSDIGDMLLPSVEPKPQESWDDWVRSCESDRMPGVDPEGPKRGPPPESSEPNEQSEIALLAHKGSQYGSNSEGEQSAESERIGFLSKDNQDFTELQSL